MNIIIENCPAGYKALGSIFMEALNQSANGKGKDRHAEPGQHFESQPICTITRNVGRGFTAGQAIKKIVESRRLPPDMAVAELLGAMVYIAADIIVLREASNGA